MFQEIRKCQPGQLAWTLAILVLLIGSGVVAGERQIVPATRGVARQLGVVNVRALAAREAEQGSKPPMKKLVEPRTHRPVRRSAVITAAEPACTAVASDPSPPVSASFLGLDDDNTAVPPDTQGAVGPGHLLVTLNSQMRIQTRGGDEISTVSMDSFWAELGDPVTFDPQVRYDPYGERWIYSAAADARTSTAAILVAVSETSDPTGNWFRYVIDADPLNFVWADHPNLGFNKHWIVFQADMYNTANSVFNRAHIYAFDKANLYANGAGDYSSFQILDNASQMPATTYDNTLETMYLVEEYDASAGQLRVSTITGAVGAEVFTKGTAFPTTAYRWDIGDEGDFARQLGSSRRIDCGDSRILSCVFRNGSLWCVQNVFLPASEPTRCSVQWWQFAPGGAIQQIGRVDDPTGVKFYAFPSIGVNAVNDVLIGYSRLGSNQYASANYSFRFADDPPNTLRTDTVLKAGEASYYKLLGGSLNRWGDYSATVPDPVDDTTLWTIQEYAAAPTGGSDRWGTWWGKLDPRAKPKVKTTISTDTPAGNNNGAIDPGETIRETIVLRNKGSVACTNLTATLVSATPGITLLQPAAAYPDLPALGTTTNAIPFEYRVAKTVACGSEITFTNLVTANGPQSTSIVTHTVGTAHIGAVSTNSYDSPDVPRATPDQASVYSTNFIGTAGIIDDVNVAMRLNHSYDGDLIMALIHPDGTQVTLVNGRGGSTNNFGTGTCGASAVYTVFDDEAATSITNGIAPFAGSYQPEGSLGALDGRAAAGTWQLRVTDKNLDDTGTLLCWSLRIISHQEVYTCSTFSTAPVASNQAVSVAGNVASPLQLIAIDLDGDPLTFATNSLPVHGLLSGFNPLTGAITYTPAHGYSGPDSFTFSVTDGASNSAPAAVDLTVTAHTDSDADGMPDYWEILYGVNAKNSDPDGDGQKNLEEYLANTDPRDPISALRITSLTRNAAGHSTIVWTTVGGTRYRVRYSDGDSAGNFTGLFTDIVRPVTVEIDPAAIGVASSMSFIDDFTLTGNPPPHGVRYYQIKVVQ